MSAVQVRGEVLSIRRVGAYHQLTLVAPGVAEQVRPGHFVALAVGGETSAHLLRRAFSVYRTQDRGVYGGTVDIVFAEHGPGTRWLAHVRQHDSIDVVGPLGKALCAAQRTGAVHFGGWWLRQCSAVHAGRTATRERAAGSTSCSGRRPSARLFGVLDAKRMSQSVAVATEDGSLGERGRVTDVLPEVLSRTKADVIYACGPMGMLAAVADLAARFGAHSQCAVEEAMACGVGVCMTCVLPVIGDDGVTRDGSLLRRGSGVSR